MRMAVFLLSMFLACSSNAGRSRTTTLEKALKDPGLLKKLDAGLKLRLAEVNQSGQLSTELPVVVRCRGELMRQARRQLEDKGVHIHAQVGDIVTATILAKDFPEVLREENVLFLELAKEAGLRPPQSKPIEPVKP